MTLPDYDGSFAMFELYNELHTKHPIIFITVSVGFDLIPSILTSIFTFVFYQGIEISHPLYAIILLNLVVSTVSSFTSFIISLINSILRNFLVGHLLYMLNSVTIFTTIISFTIIVLCQQRLNTCNSLNISKFPLISNFKRYSSRRKIYFFPIEDY